MNSFRKELRKLVPIESEKTLGSKIYIFLKGNSSKEYFPCKIGNGSNNLKEDDKNKPNINFVIETKEEDFLSNVYFKAFSLDSLNKISQAFEVFETIEDLKSELEMRVAKGLFRLSFTDKGAEITFSKMFNEEITLVLPLKKEDFNDKFSVIATKLSDLQKKVNEQDAIISKVENVKRNEKAFLKEKEELKAKNLELNKKIIEMSAELSKAKEEISFFNKGMGSIQAASQAQRLEELQKEYKISNTSFSCFGMGNMVKRENIFKDFDEKLQEIMNRKYKVNNEFDIQASLKEIKAYLPKVIQTSQRSFQDKVKEDLKLLEDSFIKFAEKVQIPQQSADFDKIKCTLNASIKKVNEISEASVSEKNKEIDLEKIKSNLDFLLSGQAKAVSDIKKAMDSRIKEQKNVAEKQTKNNCNLYQEKIQDLEKFSQEIIEKITTTFEEFSKLGSDIKTVIDDFSEKQCKASQIKDVSTALEEMEKGLEDIEEKVEESQKGKAIADEIKEEFLSRSKSYDSKIKKVIDLNKNEITEVLDKINSEIEEGKASKEKSLESIKNISENFRAMEEAWKNKVSYIQSDSINLKEKIEMNSEKTKAAHLASSQQMRQLDDSLKIIVDQIKNLTLELEDLREKNRNLTLELEDLREKNKNLTLELKDLREKNKNLKRKKIALELEKITLELEKEKEKNKKLEKDKIKLEENNFFRVNQYTGYKGYVENICETAFEIFESILNYPFLITVDEKNLKDFLENNINQTSLETILKNNLIGRINLTNKIRHAYKEKFKKDIKSIKAELLFLTNNKNKIKDYHTKCKEEKFLLFIWSEKDGSLDNYKCFFTTIGDIVAKGEEIQKVDEFAFFTELSPVDIGIKTASDKKKEEEEEKKKKKTITFYEDEDNGPSFWEYTIKKGVATKVGSLIAITIDHFSVYRIRYQE